MIAMLARSARVALVTVLVGLWTAASAQAAIITPSGLNPGDQFRVVFVSSTTRNAVSANIADYDLFITNRAVAAGIDTYFGDPVTWQAIGSTPSVSAISRLPATSPALYRIDGPLVATSGTDLWNGSIANAINRTESGAVVSGSFDAVWTGTFSSGAGGGNFAFGGSNFGAIFGLVNNTNAGWVFVDAEGRTLPFRIYGYSSVLTVPGTAEVVPEPSTLTLLGIGALALAVYRRWRRLALTPVTGANVGSN